MTHRVQPGQTYRSLNPDDELSVSGPRRIKIVSPPVTTPGLYGFGTAVVVTLTDDGREIRRRHIEASQLHESATTRDGKPRRTGYALETQ